MSRQKTKKPKSLQKKHASEPDITPEEAAMGLREEIIAEVKLLAEGKIRSVYGLVAKGRELIALESGDFNLKPAPKAQEPELTVNDI